MKGTVHSAWQAQPLRRWMCTTLTVLAATMQPAQCLTRSTAGQQVHPPC